MIKISINKFFYELNVRIPVFSCDNLTFKFINMPKKLNFDNVYLNLKIKKLTKDINLFLLIIYS